MPVSPPLESPEGLPQDIPHVTGLPEIEWPEMPLEPELAKIPEQEPTHEVMTAKDILFATTGALALSGSMLYRGIKGRFFEYATRFHEWKKGPEVIAPPHTDAADFKPSSLMPEPIESSESRLYHGTTMVEEWEDMLAPEERSAQRRQSIAEKTSEKHSQLYEEKEQAKQAKIKQRQEWLDPRRVLELRETIDDELARKLPDQKLFGEHIRVGDKESTLRQDIIKSLLEEYFHTSTKTLEEGKQIPMWLQAKVSNMLGMPKHQLKELAQARDNKAKRGKPQPNPSSKSSQASISRHLKLVKQAGPPTYKGKPLPEVNFVWPPKQETKPNKKAA